MGIIEAFWTLVYFRDAQREREAAFLRQHLQRVSA